MITCSVDARPISAHIRRPVFQSLIRKHSVLMKHLFCSKIEPPSTEKLSFILQELLQRHEWVSGRRQQDMLKSNRKLNELYIGDKIKVMGNDWKQNKSKIGDEK